MTMTLLDWNSDPKRVKDEAERFIFGGFGRVMAILIRDIETSYAREYDQMGHCWDKINDMHGLLNALQIALDAVSHIDDGEKSDKKQETEQ